MRALQAFLSKAATEVTLPNAEALDQATLPFKASGASDMQPLPSRSANNLSHHWAPSNGMYASVPALAHARDNKSKQTIIDANPQMKLPPLMHYLREVCPAIG